MNQIKETGMSDEKQWINPHQWVIDLGCRIKYNADKLDELAIADMILEACEPRERKAKADGMAEAGLLILSERLMEL